MQAADRIEQAAGRLGRAAGKADRAERAADRIERAAGKADRAEWVAGKAGPAADKAERAADNWGQDSEQALLLYRPRLFFRRWCRN